MIIPIRQTQGFFANKIICSLGRFRKYVDVDHEGEEVSFSFDHIHHVCTLVTIVEVKNDQESTIDDNCKEWKNTIEEEYASILKNKIQEI